MFYDPKASDTIGIRVFPGRKIYVGAWRWWEYYLGFAPALYFLQKIDKHICIGVGREEQIELKVEGEPPPPSLSVQFDNIQHSS